MEMNMELGVEEVIHNPGVIEEYLQKLPEKAMHLGMRVVFAIIFLLVGLEAIKIIRKILKKSLKRINADKGVIQFLDSFIKVSLYVILFFMIATGFGLDATSVVAVIGSAGVALSLALQGSLSNFAGGVLILLLKPFIVGDYIIEGVGKQEGAVTEIQLFYTKLTTPDNKVIVLPNGTLANNSLTNVTAARVRRMDIRIGISYDADIRKAKSALQDVLEQDEKVLADRDRLVFVDELADSAVIIGVRCWFSNEDFWEGKWRVTENSKLALDRAGILIPYPQMDVHVKTEE